MPRSIPAIPPYGFLLDDLKPTLTVSAPRPGVNSMPIEELRFAFADNHSGIDLPSLSVTADFAINGRAAGAELADLAVPLGDGRYAIALSTAITQASDRHLRVAIRDQQGNITRVNQAFRVDAIGDLLLRDGFEF